MSWFQRLTGFVEANYDDTRHKLVIDGRRLRSLVNGKSYGIGELELVSLQSLRDRVSAMSIPHGRLIVTDVTGDVRHLHRAPEYSGALFQVASQFNLLEMIGPNVTPEQGVTRYESDPTQGPACAIAAGAATIYRNYFTFVGEQIGQTRVRQLDGLADMGASLGGIIGLSVSALWTMQNGYAMCSREGLDAITRWLTAKTPDEIDSVRGKLRIGVHSDVEVTDVEESPGPSVSQAFCSALPVAYSDVPSIHWRGFASLVLEAAYEATLLAAVCNAQRGASNVVMLTRLGGGAFGNSDDWIQGAMRRALRLSSGFALDVRVVSYGSPLVNMLELVREFGLS
jgi:hypothetical protein